MQILLIETSLNPKSRSSTLAQIAWDDLKKKHPSIERLSLKDLQLPLCDGDAAYAHPNIAVLNQKVAAADAILFAVPIHNYSIAASTKNLIELIDRPNIQDKLVAFIVAAGGTASQMAIMPFANSLMLDFRCIVLPRFVYAHYGDFEAGQPVPQTLHPRISDLNDKLIEMGKALQVLKKA